MPTLKDTMICRSRHTGHVFLAPWPDTDRRTRDCYTTGACFFHIQEMRFEDRKKMAFIEAMHLIVREGCDPAVVHKVMLGLEEYRDGCADDMPGIREYRQRGW